MAESSAINKSLSVLGQVVHALNRGAVSPFSFGEGRDLDFVLCCFRVVFMWLYMCVEGAKISYLYIYTDYMRYFFLFSLEPNSIPEF